MKGNSRVRKYKVVFDLDGVLADFVWAFSGLGKEKFGWGQIPNSKQMHWDWVKDITHTGLTESKEQENILWDIVDKSPDFWETLPVLCDGYDIRSMNDLRDNYAQVVYCTNRFGDTVRAQTARWLVQHDFPDGEL